MKTLVFALSICALQAMSSSVHADIYISGHSDLGVGFEDGNLHLHLHAEEPLGLYGGGTKSAGEYEPGELLIGVPDPSIARPTGSQWNFLAANVGDSVWFIPQSSNPLKPFLGFGTEELMAADGWTTPLTWTFNSITTFSGNSSEFALWQNDSFGNPVVFASTLSPTGTGNSWTQNAFSHDHYNFGFTGEGIYDVNLTISGTNSGSGSIAPGLYTDTASFRFVTGAR
ncbi:MAG: choice-of-anchor M domain-containing protein [Pirellulaceae bacterium]